MNLYEIKKKRKEAFSGSTVVNDWQYQAYLKGIEDGKKYGLPDIEVIVKHFDDRIDKAVITSIYDVIVQMIEDEESFPYAEGADSPYS